MGVSYWTSTRLIFYTSFYILHCYQSVESDKQLTWNDDAILDLDELEREINEVLGQSSSNKGIDGTGCNAGEKAWLRTVEATRWVLEQDQLLRRKLHDLTLAEWNYSTNISTENSNKYESLQNAYDDWWVALVSTSRDYLGVAGGVASGGGSYQLCNKTTERLLRQIVYRQSIPPAKDPQTSRSINHLINEMSGIYSMATVSSRTGSEATLRLDPELTQIMSTSRDPEELEWAWLAWHNASGRPIRPLYTRLVELMNEAARDNGFRDVGESWQMSDYETTELEEMLDDLYSQLRPFYEQLHAYVRSRLAAVYPLSRISQSDSIPIHLLGDMWGQQWDEIFELVAPYPEVSASRDVTGALKRNGYTVRDMFHTAEEFFTSLGLEPMTDQFWARSVLERIPDRQMVCHGSAHDFFTNSDFRIKMCTTVTSNDFFTVHHEMGHIQYYMLYRAQPALFRGGANAAFHEAVGDTISLSVATPTHLQAIRLINQSEGGKSDQLNTYKQEINYLMQIALQKVSFLPFAYVVDKWRFAVFRGAIKPQNYNKEWWKMRERYGGVRAPVGRSESDFDPGAKYHIPNNVPYSRYFLSFIAQFQFHEALCSLAGLREGEELSLCDIYQSQAAGDRLRSVLGLGVSKPWPETMKMFTGQSEFSVSSLLKYFRPLIRWLKRANRNSTLGWGVNE